MITTKTRLQRPHKGSLSSTRLSGHGIPKQNERASRPTVSEAHMMMDVMNRHAGWCVLVCLVGGGQEINRGEAGLPEWGVALRGFDGWKIYASPEVLNDTSGGSFSLFSEDTRRPGSDFDD